MFYMQKDTLTQIIEIVSKNKKIHQIEFLDALTLTSYGVKEYSYDQNGFMVKQDNFNMEASRLP